MWIEQRKWQTYAHTERQIVRLTTKKINIFKNFTSKWNQFPFGSQIVETLYNTWKIIQWHENFWSFSTEPLLFSLNGWLLKVFPKNFIWYLVHTFISMMVKCFLHTKDVPLQKVCMCVCVWPLFREIKWNRRWLLIRLYGLVCNLVLPLPYNFASFIYGIRIQWFCIHVKRSDAFESWEISSYYGDVQ